MTQLTVFLLCASMLSGWFLFLSWRTGSPWHAMFALSTAIAAIFAALVLPIPDWLHHRPIGSVLIEECLMGLWVSVTLSSFSLRQLMAADFTLF